MISKPQIRFKGPAWQRDFASISKKIKVLNKAGQSATNIDERMVPFEPLLIIFQIDAKSRFIKRGDGALKPLLEGGLMSIANMLDEIKRHTDFEKVGMILIHNGVVRATTRDGRRVKGLKVAVDHAKLEQIITEQSQKPGIVAIRVNIIENKNLAVGDDIMHLIVAGDIRENVISVLTQTLDAIKKKVTKKTEYFMEL